MIIIEEIRPSKSLSVVIMAYNEANNLEPVVKEIIETLNELKRKHEIIIINDGSTDGTQVIANKLQKQHPQIRLISHITNLGLGKVYRSGFDECRYDCITFFPADGQFPSSIISTFLPFMDNYDMVLGYLPKRKRPLLSKILSKSERILYRILFGKLPEFQGVFMLQRHILNDITLISSGRGWAIVLELIYRVYHNKHKIISVPTQLRPRLSGKSKVNNLRTIIANIQQVLELKMHL
jgi:glycosyltransferase involved in cell wall biosynthesis